MSIQTRLTLENNMVKKSYGLMKESLHDYIGYDFIMEKSSLEIHNVDFCIPKKTIYFVTILK